MTILAIGGAVVKTALDELNSAVATGRIEMLIHNGASLFHDFQRATDDKLADMGMHSYPVEALLDNKELDRPASDLVWKWRRGRPAPVESVTRMCEDEDIPVLCFSGMGTDFWHLFDNNWELFARTSREHFYTLVDRMSDGPFHYLLMGSAVIHPEVFRSALSVARPRVFTADVVDFKEMYRPRTRVACYGKYHQIDFKSFLTEWLKGAAQ